MFIYSEHKQIPPAEWNDDLLVKSLKNSIQIQF